MAQARERRGVAVLICAIGDAKVAPAILSLVFTHVFGGLTCKLRRVMLTSAHTTFVGDVQHCLMRAIPMTGQVLSSARRNWVTLA